MKTNAKKNKKPITNNTIRFVKYSLIRLTKLFQSEKKNGTNKTTKEFVGRILNINPSRAQSCKKWNCDIDFPHLNPVYTNQLIAAKENTCENEGK